MGQILGWIIGVIIGWLFFFCGAVVLIFCGVTLVMEKLFTHPGSWLIYVIGVVTAILVFILRKPIFWLVSLVTASNTFNK